MTRLREINIFEKSPETHCGKCRFPGKKLAIQEETHETYFSNWDMVFKLRHIQSGTSFSNTKYSDYEELSEKSLAY